MLSDLIEKERGYQNAENKSNNEESSSDLEEEGRRKKKRKRLLRMVLKLKTPKRATTTLKTTVRKQKVASSPKTSVTFHFESPSEHCENFNAYGTLIMKCPRCFWHDYYKICPICDHQVPKERNCIKKGFLRCHECGAITHKNAKTLETNFHSLLKRARRRELIYFHFFQITVYLTLFDIVFLIKFLKQYLLSGFIARINLLVACC